VGEEFVRAKEFITEDVGGDYIYHSVTTPNQIWNILEKGEIEPNLSETDEDGGWEIPVISASRSQYYRFPYGAGSVQLVLDRSALRRAGYKVFPFSYMQFYGNPDGTTPTSSNPMYKQETEERIFHPKGIGIPVKSPFVVGIQFRKELMEKIPKKLLDLIAEKGLTVSSMRHDPTNKKRFLKTLTKPPKQKKFYFKPEDIQIVRDYDDPTKYSLWTSSTNYSDPGMLDKGWHLSKDRAVKLYHEITGGIAPEIQTAIYKRPHMRLPGAYHDEHGNPKLKDEPYVPPMITKE
jgi:hypothetical protein